MDRKLLMIDIKVWNMIYVKGIITNSAKKKDVSKHPNPYLLLPCKMPLKMYNCDVTVILSCVLFTPTI